MAPVRPAPSGAAGLLAALSLLLGGCDTGPRLEWSVVAGPGVDPESIEFVQAQIREGSCDAGGTVRWSGEARRDGGGASFSSPGTLGAGTWCFAAVGGASDCAELAVGEVERALPAERDPVEVVLRPSSEPCVPVMDAGAGDGGLPDGALDAGADAGPPPPVRCWPGDAPESFPPPEENGFALRSLRRPLEDPEFCPTAYSELRQDWGDALCAEQAGAGFSWSLRSGDFDGCVEAARHLELTDEAPGVLRLISPAFDVGGMVYDTCTVSFSAGVPDDAGGAPLRMCTENTAERPLALLCEKPVQGALDIDAMAEERQGLVDVVYDPRAERYAAVYAREGSIGLALVGPYGKSVETKVVAEGPPDERYRFPRIALGDTGSATRFGVIWEEESPTTGGPQRYVVLDGVGDPVSEAAYLVDPDMHEFLNNRGALDVAFDAPRREFVFAGLATRQSEPDIYGRLQVLRTDADGATLGRPEQLESVEDDAGRFTPAFIRLVFHPDREELLVRAGRDVLVLPSGDFAPRAQQVIRDGMEDIVPLHGTDDYLAVSAGRVTRLDAEGTPRGWVSWAGLLGEGPARVLHFPADGAGAMAGMVLVQRGTQLRYLTPELVPCFPNSAWREPGGGLAGALGGNTSTGGFARFSYGSGLAARFYLSNGDPY